MFESKDIVIQPLTSMAGYTYAYELSFFEGSESIFVGKFDTYYAACEAAKALRMEAA